MAQKTQPTSADVEAFLAAVPDEGRRSDARELSRVLSEWTGEPPVLWGTSIVGFGSYHYRYESGREGDSALVGFAPRKSQLVVYVSAALDDHRELLEKLGPHKTGKGCLYLKRLADVDLDVLHELVERTVRERRDVASDG